MEVKIGPSCKQNQRTSGLEIRTSMPTRRISFLRRTAMRKRGRRQNDALTLSIQALER